MRHCDVCGSQMVEKALFTSNYWDCEACTAAKEYRREYEADRIQDETILTLPHSVQLNPGMIHIDAAAFGPRKDVLVIGGQEIMSVAPSARGQFQAFLKASQEAQINGNTWTCLNDGVYDFTFDGSLLRIEWLAMKQVWYMDPNLGLVAGGRTGKMAGHVGVMSGSTPNMQTLPRSPMQAARDQLDLAQKALDDMKKAKVKP